MQTFTSYRETLAARDTNPAAHAVWLAAARELLTAHNTTSLVESAEAETLHSLAYAGLCFWHLPIAPYIKAIEDGDPMGLTDALLSSVAAQSPSSRLADFIHGKGTPKDPHWTAICALNAAAFDPQADAAVRQTLAELDLTARAFQASLAADVEQAGLQAALFSASAKRLSHDGFLQKYRRGWGEARDRARATKDASEIQEIAAHITGVLHDEARRIAPKIFDDAMTIEPTMFFASLSPTKSSGTYNYDKPTQERPHGTGYYFVNVEDRWALSTLPFFISFCLHEALHTLQCHQMHKQTLHKRFSSTLSGEAMSFSCPTLQGQASACRTYPLLIQPGPNPMDAVLRAYMWRPTEYYAHQFGNALEQHLCDAWQSPRAFNTVRFDTTEFSRAALSGRPVRPVAGRFGELSPLCSGQSLR